MSIYGQISIPVKRLQQDAKAVEIRDGVARGNCVRPLLLICVLDSMTLEGPNPQTEYYTPEINREQRRLDHRPFVSLDAMSLVNIDSFVYPGCAVVTGPGRSGTTTYGVVPKTKQTIGKHAFSVAAPINSLESTSSYN